MSNTGEVCSGFLTKAPAGLKSPNGKSISKWRRRWFVLHRTSRLACLQYWVSQDKMSLKGTVTLNKDTILNPHVESPKYGHMFSVKTPNREYFLAADDEAQYKVWIAALAEFTRRDGDTPDAGTPDPTPEGAEENLIAGWQQEMALAQAAAGIAGIAFADLSDSEDDDSDTLETSSDDDMEDENSNIDMSVMHGVTLDFLKRFADLVSEPTWTAAEVCEHVVKPASSVLHCSYVDLLLASDDINDRESVGEATHYVCYAWNTTFSKLLQELITFAEEESTPEKQFVYWIDLFAVNQHTNPERPRVWWTKSLPKAIGKIGETLLMFSPWDNPAALTRAWCLFEVLCTTQVRGRLNIRMVTEDASSSFWNTMITRLGDLRRAVNNIDVGHSAATHMEDRDMIFTTVRNTLGFPKVTAIVKSKLRECLSEFGRQALRRAGVRGGEQEDTLTLTNDLAMLYLDMGRHQDAEPLFRDLMSTYETLHGDKHPKTLNVYEKLGLVFKELGMKSDAEGLLTKALEIRKDVLGEKHPDTMSTMNHLGVFYQSIMRREEAKQLFSDALQYREEVLGPDHRETLVSVMNLAQLLRLMKKLEEAEPLYRRVLDIRERTCDATNHATLQAVNNLGALMQAMGRHADAEPFYRRALLARESTLGPRHPSTLTSVSNLSVLLKAIGKLEEAEWLSRRALSAREELLGPRHIDTLQSVNNLGSLLKAQGKYDEAVNLLQRAAFGFEERLGSSHDATLAVKKNLLSLQTFMAAQQ